jgi:DMSO/TMAO reductase YedYZ molybdopterin-dependent catalytic subunit
MIDLDDPVVAKHVEQKARLRARAQSAPSTSASTSTSTSTPRGQRVVRSWIKLDLGRPIPPTHDPWTLGNEFAIECIARASAKVTLGELKAANGGAWSEFSNHSWHCVTGWTCEALTFRGVDLNVLMRCAFGDDARDAMASCACLYQIASDGYTVGVDARDVAGAFLAVEDGDGSMLSREHGGPRLVFPALFGWKSAKYLSTIKLLERYEDGFWERLGCHRRGRWAMDERWSENAAGVWNWLAWMTNLYAKFGGEKIWIWVMVRGGSFLGSIAAMFTSLFRVRATTPATKSE